MMVYTGVMTHILSEHIEAASWVERVTATCSNDPVFGKIVSAVLWTDDVGQDGEPLVSLDPLKFIAEINESGLPVLKGHDPGFPLGRVLAADVFTKSDNSRFIAAIIGFYDNDTMLSFRGLDLNILPDVTSPVFVDELDSNGFIVFAVDPREVDAAWLEDLIRRTPLRVEQTDLSHNAAEPLLELLRVGLPYVALVWNPLVTSVATEAGKDVYSGIRQWLRILWTKLDELKNPVVEIQSQIEGCLVSFLFRGSDVQRNYDAHDELPIASMQALTLVSSMNVRGIAPRVITYEYETQSKKWFPSYAVLCDGRFVSDRSILIALEQLPSGLSIGLVRDKGM